MAKTAEQLEQVKTQIESELAKEPQDRVNSDNAKFQTESEKRAAMENEAELGGTNAKLNGLYHELRPLLGNEIAAEQLLMLLCAVLLTLPPAYSGQFVAEPTKAIREFVEVICRSKHPL